MCGSKIVTNLAVQLSRFGDACYTDIDCTRLIAGDLCNIRLAARCWNVKYTAGARHLHIQTGCVCIEFGR